jgi:Domain of unknown function (DUF5011)
MNKVIFVLFIFLLVGCEQVNPKDNTPPNITLKKSIDTVNVSTEWFDTGCEAIDNKDGSVTCILESSNIDTSKIGEYEVIYKATDSSGNVMGATRKVTVVDETKPTIILNPGIDTIKLGETWVDMGATVTDNFDSEVNYTVSSNVDITTVGEYTIIYTAIDSNGNESMIIRYVNIIQ